jgi:hypothetical protein
MPGWLSLLIMLVLLAGLVAEGPAMGLPAGAAT